jgi:hypothetical protein
MKYVKLVLVIIKIDTYKNTKPLIMKQYSIAILFLLSANITCNIKPNTITDFMPGTYVKYNIGEFGPVYDTVRIQKIETVGNNYKIERKLRFQRTIDGKIFPWENKMENSTATYNPETKQLYDNRFDKIMHFAPDKQQLFIGSTVYHKLNK